MNLFKNGSVKRRMALFICSIILLAGIVGGVAYSVATLGGVKFAEAETYTNISVSHSLLYLEHGLDAESVGIEQLSPLKDWLTVTGTDGAGDTVTLNKDEYDVTGVTYAYNGSAEQTWQNATSATISINANGITVTTTVYAVLAGVVQGANVSVNRDYAELVGNVYKIKQYSDGSGEAKQHDGKYLETVFLTTRPKEEILSYLSVDVQYQHARVPAKVLQNGEEAGKSGDVYSCQITQGSFAAGLQTVTVEIEYEPETYKTGSLNVTFENVQIAALSVEAKTDGALYSYSDLSEGYTVTGHFNDGSSRTLTDSEYAISDLTPTAGDIESITDYEAVTTVQDTYGISNSTATVNRNGITYRSYAFINSGKCSGHRYSLLEAALTQGTVLTREFYSNFTSTVGVTYDKNGYYYNNIGDDSNNDLQTTPDIYTNFLIEKYTLNGDKTNSIVIPGTKTEKSYTKDITITCANGVTCTIPGATVRLANPYQFVLGGSVQTTQTVGGKFDLSGLTVTAIYATDITDVESDRDIYGSGINTTINTTTSKILQLKDYTEFIEIKFGDGAFQPYEDAVVPESFSSIELRFSYTGTMFFSGQLVPRGGNESQKTHWSANNSSVSQVYTAQFDTTGSSTQNKVVYTYSPPAINTNTEEFTEDFSRQILNLNFNDASNGSAAVVLDKNGDIVVGNLGYTLTLYLSNNRGQKAYLTSDGIVAYDDGMSLNNNYIYRQYKFYNNGGIVGHTTDDKAQGKLWAELTLLDGGSGLIQQDKPQTVIAEFKLDQYDDVVRQWYGTNSDTVSFALTLRKANLDVNYTAITSGGTFVLSEPIASVAQGSLLAYLQNIGLNFVSGRTAVSASTAPEIYSLYVYSTTVDGLKYSDRVKIYDYESDQGTVVRRDNDGLEELLDDTVGQTYYVYVEFDGNDYYYGGSSELNALNVNVVALSLPQSPVFSRTYARETVEALANELKLTYGKEYAVSVLKNGQALLSDEVLHVGEYDVRFVIGDETVTGKLTVNVQTFDLQSTDYSGKVVFGATEGKADEILDAAKSLAEEFYYEIDETLGVNYYNITNGSSSSDLNQLSSGDCYARFATKIGAGDVVGDYNCPYLNVYFTVDKASVQNPTVAEGDFTLNGGNYETSYQGSNLRFSFSNWNDIKNYVTVSVTDARRHDGVSISPYLYVVRDGSVTVFGAGTYTVTLSIDAANCEWADNSPSDKIEYSLVVKQSALTAVAKNGFASQQAGVFEGINNFVEIVGGLEQDANGNAITYFVSEYTIYILDGPVSEDTIVEEYLITHGNPIEDVNALRIDNVYYIYVSSISSSGFWFAENSVYGFTSAYNYTFTPFATQLHITAANLDKLEFTTADNIETVTEEDYSVTLDGETFSGKIGHKVTLTYGDGTDILSLFERTTVNNSSAAYRYFFVPYPYTEGAEAKDYNALNAGEYIAIVANSTGFSWNTTAGAGNVAFLLVLQRLAVDAPAIVNVNGQYTGEETTVSVGGTASYWEDLFAKGVTVSIVCADGNGAGASFDVEKGEFKFTHAGNYSVVFSIPSTNYYWSGTEYATKFDVTEPEFTTESYSVANVARMEIEAPTLGAARVWTYGTAVSYNFENITAADGKTVAVSAAYTDSGLAVGNNHELTLTMSVPDGVLSDYAWTRNLNDIEGLAYTVAYGKPSDDFNVITLYFAVVNARYDIDFATQQTIYYGGEKTTDGTEFVSLADLVKALAFGEDTDKLETATVIVKDGDAYKTWSAETQHTVTVNVTFSDSNYTALSFSLDIAVAKKPVALTVAGSQTYGGTNVTTTISDGDDQFIDGGEHLDALTFIAQGINGKTNVGNNDVSYVVNTDDAYFDNYAITASGTYKVNPLALTLQFSSEKPKFTYGTDTESGYLSLITNSAAEATNNTADEWADILSAQISDSEVGEAQTVTYTLTSNNYTLNNNTTTVQITKATAYVTLTIDIYYGEELREGAKQGNIRYEISGTVGGESITCNVEEIDYSCADGTVEYQSGLTHRNYEFEDSGNSAFNVKPLKLRVVLQNVESDYYKPAPLTYTIEVLSESSYGEGKVNLPAVLAAQSVYSKEVNYDELEGFTLTTSAYTLVGDLPEDGSYRTGSAGTYDIIVVYGSRTDYDIEFVNTDATYTVKPVDLNKEINYAADYPFKLNGSAFDRENNASVAYSESVTDLIFVDTYALGKIVKDAYAVSYEVWRVNNNSEDSYIGNSVSDVWDAGTYRIKVTFTFSFANMPSETMSVATRDAAPDTNNYTSGTFEFFIEVEPAGDNEIIEHFNFKNGKVSVVETEDAITYPTAWVYGLYSEETKDGFNFNGDQKITEPTFKYSLGGTITYDLSSGSATLFSRNYAVNGVSANTFFTELFTASSKGGYGGLGVGEYELTITLSGRNFNNVTQKYAFRVAERVIVIKPDVTIVYGEAAPKTCTYKYTEAVNVIGGTGQTQEVTYEVETNYEQGNPVGDHYLLYASLENAPDAPDEFKFETGILTVIKRVVTITIGSASITYRDDLTNAKLPEWNVITSNTSNDDKDALPYTSYGLYLNNGESKDKYLTLFHTSLAKNEGDSVVTANAGDYPIYLVWTEAGEGVKGNYTIYFVNCSYGEAFKATANAVGIKGDEVAANCAGTYTVRPLQVNVTWSQTSGSSFTYNGTEIALSATATIPGFAEGVSAEILLGLTRQLNGIEVKNVLNAGDYRIIAELPSSGTFKFANSTEDSYSNYTTGLSTINITIERATIRIDVDNKQISYGDAAPNYSMKIDTSGYVGALQSDVDEKEISKYESNVANYYACGYTVGSGVGVYTIGVNSEKVTFTNFTYTVVTATLSVSPRAINVAIKGYSDFDENSDERNGVTAVYNGTTKKNPNITAIDKYLEFDEGWNGKTNDAVDKLGITLSLLNAQNAGSYKLVGTANSNNNYVVTFVSTLGGKEYQGDFLITKAALTVEPYATVVYGEEISAQNVIYTIDGFAGEDTLDNLLNTALLMQKLGSYTGLPVNPDGAFSFESSYSVGTGVGLNQNMITAAGTYEFLNYTVEYQMGDVKVEARVITAKIADCEYNKDGKYNLSVSFDNLYGKDSLQGNYVLENMPSAKEVGDYTVTVTLKENVKNYTFEDGQTGKSVNFNIVKKTLKMSWATEWLGETNGSVLLTTDMRKATNTLIGFDPDIMNYNVTRTYMSTEYPDGSYELNTTNATSVLTAGDGGLLFESNLVGTYQITFTFKDAKYADNYQWAGASSNTYTMSVVIATNYYEMTVGVSDKTYDGTAIAANVTVENGLNNYITTVYVPISYEQYQTLQRLEKLTSSEIEENTGIKLNWDTIGEFSQEAPANADYYILYSVYYRVQELTSAYKLFHISRATISAPEFADSEVYKYNGNVINRSVNGFDAQKLSYSLEGNGLAFTNGKLSATNAGTYTITFAVTDSNYTFANGDENIKLTWAIGKATDQTIRFTEDVKYVTYGDSSDGIVFAHELTYSDGASYGYIYYVYKENGEYTTADIISKPTNVGKYYVRVLVSGDNFEDANGSTVLVIEKKEVVVTANVSVTYGSDINLKDIVYTYAGFANNDNASVLAITSNLKVAQSTYEPFASVGTYRLNFETEELNLSSGTVTNILGFVCAASTADNYYYTLSSNSLITVTALPVTVTIGSASSAYGLEPNTSNVTLSVAETIAEKYDTLKELLGITLSVNCDKSSAAGDNYVISATYANNNYAVTFNNGKYTIAPMGISVEISAGGGTYGGTITPTCITKVTTASGEQLTLADVEEFFTYLYSKNTSDGTGDGSYVVPTNAGAYFVTVGLDSAKTTNYTLIGNVYVSFNIEKQTLDVANISTDSLVYTGGVCTPKIIDNFYNVTAALEDRICDSTGKVIYYIDRTKEYVNAATYTITLTIADNDNIQWSTGSDKYEMSFAINKALNSVSAMTIEGWTFGEYDNVKNAPNATLSYTADELNIVYEYKTGSSDWSTTVPTDAGVYYVRAVVAATENYEAFTSGGYPFTIAKKQLTLPSLDVISEGNGKNDTYTGSALLLKVLNYNSALMSFTYIDAQSIVDGDSVTLTAINAGKYTVVFWLTNTTNYIWADSDELNDNGQVELSWTVAKMKVARPVHNTDTFKVDGLLLTYIPNGFDEQLMTIEGNETHFNGSFTAIVALKDTDNYEWDNGSVGELRFNWEAVGVSNLYVAIVSVVASLAGAALLFAGGQFLMYKRKKRILEKDMDDRSAAETENAEAAQEQVKEDSKEEE